MQVRIYFDGTSTANNKLPDSAIVGLSQSAHAFGENFKVGSTICRTFTLKVLKSYIDDETSHPYIKKNPGYVLIYPLEAVRYATLFVDSIDDTDDIYYQYNLVDRMAFTNKALDWSAYDTSSVAKVLKIICDEFKIGNWQTDPPRYDPPINYEDGSGEIIGRSLNPAMDNTVTARDFIGYVAEINGGYAYISPTGYLKIAKFSNTSEGTIYDYECDSLKIGTRHNINRVVYDNSLGKYEYPVPSSEGNSEGEMETLYLNPDNILFDDGGGSDIDTLVHGVYDIVNGLDFYNITVNKCPVANIETIRAGQMITVVDSVRNINYPTILQIDWEYNGGWLGGLDLNLQSAAQEETQIKNPIETRLNGQINTIKTEINRQDGELSIIGTHIDTVEDKIDETNIYFRVRAAESDVIVTNQSDADPKAYTSFKEDGMRIYVNGEEVAEATSARFECDKGLGVQDWVIESPNGKPYLLNIYRRI